MAMLVLSRLRRLGRDRRGISAVETALTVPVVLAAIAIGYDLSSFGTTQSRVREVAFRVADFAASDDGLGTSGRLTNVADIRATVRSMLTPYKVCDVASVVLTGVTNPGGRGQTIAWQEKWHYPTPQGGGECLGVASTTVTSSIGAVGAAPDYAAVLPNQSIKAMAVRDKDALVVAEIVYRDVKAILPRILVHALPSTHVGAGAARVRAQIP
jgi:hypothetical protein